MKRKLFSFLSLFIALTVSAQLHQRIELTDNQSEPVEVSSDVCKVYISRTPSASDSDLNLTVDVENTDEHYYLLIFGHGFDEKTLKKQKPSIRFDKGSYGLTSRNIIPFKDKRSEEVVSIEPAGGRHTFNIERLDGKLEIAIYVAEYKPKKFLSSEKLLIKRRLTLDVDIEVKQIDRQDEDLQRLNEDYEKLIEELKEQSFCPRRSHPISLSDQKAPFEEKIRQLLSDISNIKKRNRWRDNDQAYVPYKELKEKLENIDLRHYEKYCGSCKKANTSSSGSIHNCSYCNLSLEGAGKYMERIYMQYDQGKITKSEAISKAKALRSCANLAKKMNANRSKAKRIDDYYNRIVK